jgi:proteasome activator subunit 3 (PA28 gamma)
MKQIAIIKLWIQLMIPKVEDGNNFGVSIQEVRLSL